MRLWTFKELEERDKEPIFVARVCSECNTKDFDVLIELGQPFDYDSLTAYICIRCLKKGIELMAGCFV